MKLKVIVALLLVCLSGLFAATRANAQFHNGNYLNTNPDVPQNFHSYTQSVFIEIASALSCQITGIDPINPEGKCLGIDQKTGKIGFVENGGGLLGITGNMIASTFNIPISSTHYAGYLADNFGIAKRTYAVSGSGLTPTQQQTFEGGVGFRGLMPILGLWKTFRNIVYLFFVFIFIIIGLGIMFRIKIDPRTVMTIQNQIPKIIIGLVLVTFSYAIAGFLIDMMYVTLYLVFNTFYPHISDISRFSPAEIQGANPLTAVGLLGGVKMAGEAAWGLGGIIGSLFDGTIGKILAAVVGGILGSVIGGSLAGGIPIVGGLAGGLLGAGVGFFAGTKILAVVGGIIAFVVLAAAILSALFRLWFQLLKAYIFILINITLAPFWIAIGLIPGSTINFSAWIRDVVGNLAAFPATLAMLLMGKIFMDAFGTTPSTDPRFVPPFIGNPGNPSQFGALIGVGIVLLTPNVVNMVRQAIKAPEAKFTAAIGQSVKVGADIAGAGPKTASNVLFRKPRYLGDPGGYGYQQLQNIGPNNVAMRALRTLLGVTGKSSS